MSLTTASPDYRQWTAQVTNVATTVGTLKSLAKDLGLRDIAKEPWHGALFQKLLPQVQQGLFLIAAVTGGTNTGKSTIFNHLAGSAVSRANPDATQTRHPVCLVPQGFSTAHSLSAVFPDFQLRLWTSENDPLDDNPDDLLFERKDPHGLQPPQLLLLDTPDVDGTLKENWHRAELLRHAADVLVCVLTQQKYNDATIRDFFRSAAKADKTVVVVFNMVHGDRQRELCAGWLKQFCGETGVHPEAVYAVPWDPERAEQNQLPFFPLSPGATDNLGDYLANLQFDKIKLRSLKGSLQQLTDPRDGLPAFLLAIDQKAAEYAGAWELLSHSTPEQKENLPDFPRDLVWDEVWKWLQLRRYRPDRWVNGFYRWVGGPFRSLWRHLRGSDPAKSRDNYLQYELDQLKMALDAELKRLERLRAGGNAILAKELTCVLGGLQRSHLFDELERRHKALPLVTDRYRQFIHEHLDAFERQYPTWVKGITYTLLATAVVRPAISLSLGVVGAHGVDVAVGHWAVSWVGDVAVGAGVATAVAGDAVAVPIAGQKALQLLLQDLFARFYIERGKLVTDMLDSELGPVIERLNRLAAAPLDPQRLQAEKLIVELQTLVDQANSQQAAT